MFTISNGCVIRDLRIDGNREALTAPTWENTIEILANGANALIDNVEIINGNEAIMLGGENIVVKNCRLSNCGGNGLHFSGCNKARVDNCVIIGANLNNSMGNMGGCIKWCRKCTDIVVSNCWVENGKRGFGDIEGGDNCGIQLIGNTAKNCGYAVYVNAVVGFLKNIIINGNRFIDCGSVRIDSWHEAANDLIPLNIILSNNIFENCSLELVRCSDIIISNNIMKGNSYIHGQFVSDIKISDNAINQTGDKQAGIHIENDNSNIEIVNNYIRSKGRVLAVKANACSVIGNSLWHNYADDNEWSAIIQCSGGNAMFKDNKVVSYKNGIELTGNSTYENNLFYMCGSQKQVFVDWGSTYYRIQNNRTNGTMIADVNTSEKLISNNSFPVHSNVFKTVSTTFENITAKVQTTTILGDDIECVLVASEGYSLPASVTIKNNGQTAEVGFGYEYNQETGKLIIYKVRGDVSITATATATA